ncbi:thiamine pyrophosphate-binding protein [Janthinobacterium fluminis]|uniref:pyruvate decarboxylase n=1 Tax=Janthinobacterium fluminis TaxID=2987524 RepID=A0ABT5JWS2_9BURK|nr:thiamine pyrophosphate-binding protein [Janthinobacterium fluminis]MDC8756921.1 thiamine pyrophosphate-binding protein [Janthinobacterium fluminis]
MSQSYLLSPKQYQRQFRSPQALYDARSKHGADQNALSAFAVRADADGETVATYLNKRLAEIGVGHVMAIPGDYISEWVETLDTEHNAGLVRVHPNNEMCATYAADGYGRATGGAAVGCVATTYGVGALNAVQAVAGAFVESVPLVLVNGSPSPAQFNSQRDQGVLWHHMFDGSYTDLRVFQEVTQMAVRIDNPAYAPDLIDAALSACITTSKPVYIEIANTMEAFPVASVASRPPLLKAAVPQNQTSLDEAVASVLPVLVGARKLVVLGGMEVARFGLQESFKKLLTTLKAPYLSSLLGKSILSEYNAPYFSGTYNGKNSQQNVQDLVRAADVILSIGVHETDFNFSGLASVDSNPDALPGLPIAATIEVRKGAARINSALTDPALGSMYWGDIALAPFVASLAEVIGAPTGAAMNALVAAYPSLATVQQALVAADSRLPGVPFPALVGPVWDIPPVASFPAGAQITWDSFKSLLHHEYLTTFGNDENGDAPVVLADTGLSFYNLNNIKSPQNGFIAQLAWGAIGYSPAASYGVKLALARAGSKRRVISVSGDGAFAQSCNAIGTIGELGLDNVVFVMANGVFAIEQFLINANAFCASDGGGQGTAPPFAALCRVPQTALWDWKALAQGFGGVGYEVTTNEELTAVLQIIKEGSPPPRVPTGPCADGSGTGCAEFDGGPPPPRRSTFTLVAVRNVSTDLPSNTRWKLDCGGTPAKAGA